MIDVLVVVGVRLYREAVVRVLNEQPDLHVSGDAPTSRYAQAGVERSRPDVVLLDLDLEGALAAVRSTRSASPSTHIVALGFGGNGRDVLVAAEAGVSGYVGIGQPLCEVPAAIRAVMRGEAPLDGHIASVLLRRVRATGCSDPKSPLATLTSRERHVLQLVAHGLTNREIAGELLVSVATVKSHVSAILRKLELSGRNRCAAAALLRDAEFALSSEHTGGTRRGSFVLTTG
jgi:two-component system, NarL family, nitrate/nitrite response regulator NarL